MAVDSDTRPVAAKAPSRKASSSLISAGTCQASATSPASKPAKRRRQQRPQLGAVAQRHRLAFVDLVEAPPDEPVLPGHQQAVVGRADDLVAGAEHDLAHRPHTAVVEGVGLADAVERGDLDDLVAEAVGLLALVQAADADEPVAGRDQRLPHHALADGAGDERLDGGHHLHVPHVVDGVVAHGAGEHRQVVDPQAGSAEDRLVLVDVGDDRLDLLRRVAEPPQRPGDRLVDDEHRPAADELLGLGQRQVGLDAGGVAVHHQADGAGRGQHRRLRVAHAVDLAELDGLVPRLVGSGEDFSGTRAASMALTSARCIRRTLSVGSRFSA